MFARKRISVLYKGKTSVAEIARLPECQVSYQVLLDRLRNGMSITEAVTTPKRARSATYEAFGESKTLAEWVTDARSKVRSVLRLRRRLHTGMIFEDALTTLVTRAEEGQVDMYTAFGETKTIVEWLQDPRCARISRACLQMRLGRGMPFKDALTTPTSRRGPAPATYEAFGESKTLAEWLADERCVLNNRQSLLDRLRRMDVEDAITAPRKPGNCGRGKQKYCRKIPTIEAAATVQQRLRSFVERSDVTGEAKEEITSIYKDLIAMLGI